MKYKWMKGFMGFAFAVFLSGAVANAQTVTDLGDFSIFKTQRIKFYEDFDVGGAMGDQTFYIYNETASSYGTDTVTGGEVPALRATEALAVGIRIATLGSTSIDVRIEGRFGTSSQFTEIYTINYTAVNTIDEVINIVERVEAIRVGLKANTAGTDKVDVYALLVGRY